MVKSVISSAAFSSLLVCAGMPSACAAPVSQEASIAQESDTPSGPRSQSTASGVAEAGGRSAPARDPDVAIRQAFNMALAGQAPMTLEAFLARYPDHELAPAAAECLAAREAGQGSSACNPVETGE